MKISGMNRIEVERALTLMKEQFESDGKGTATIGRCWVMEDHPCVAEAYVMIRNEKGEIFFLCKEHWDQKKTLSVFSWRIPEFVQ